MSTILASRGTLAAKHTTSQLLRSSLLCTSCCSTAGTVGLYRSIATAQQLQPVASHEYTQKSTGNMVLAKKAREFFPQKETEKVRRTPAAWPHPSKLIQSSRILARGRMLTKPSVYTEEQMRAVTVAHREAKTWSDKVALTAVRVLRWGYVQSLLHHPSLPPHLFPSI